MEISQEKIKILDEQIQRIFVILKTLGYKQQSDENFNSGSTPELYYYNTKLTLQEIPLNLEVCYFCLEKKAKWTLSLDLIKYSHRCYLDKILPMINSDIKAEAFDFDNTEDLEEFSKRATEAMDNLIALVQGDLKPYVLGEKWQSTPVKWPGDYY
jgi:hypothetical protein